MASTFSETVTVPTLMISAVFIYTFLGNGGELSFSPAAILTIAVLILVTSLSIFGFLRELSKHVTKGSGGPSLSPTGPASTLPSTPERELALPLPSLHGDEWEESTEKRESQE